MKTRISVILAGLFVLATAAALAAPAIESTPAPKPKKPNFAPFTFFVGTWTCSEKQANRPTTAPSTATWALDSSGYWLVANADNSPVKWFPYESKAQLRVTYDPDAKLWVFMSEDDLGNYGLFTTPGWKGDTAVWTARSFFPTKDMSAMGNYTMKKISDSKYTGTYSYTNAKGTVIGGQDTCTKT